MKAKKDNSLFAYYGFTKRNVKKYPVISGILKQLTPERIKKEIAKKVLDPFLSPFFHSCLGSSLTTTFLKL